MFRLFQNHPQAEHKTIYIYILHYLLYINDISSFRALRFIYFCDLVYII